MDYHHFAYHGICIVTVILFAVLVWRIDYLNRQLDKTDGEKRLSVTSVSNEKLEFRQNCVEQTVTCFADEDCENICLGNRNVSCSNGLCRNDYVYKAQSTECDPQNGFFGYLVGEPAFGRFSQECKSLDVGIATPTENLMCRGGNIDIDYRIAYPSMDNCTDCNGKVVIPATSVKRAHVECNELYDGL